METVRDRQVGNESRTRFVEQTNAYLRAGDYSRALDLLRGAAAEFPNDAELAELEKRAHDGVERKAEADRLITESQELFAQRKPAEAIEVLRKAYELDKSNSLARAILSNALVEHAQSLVEGDWLKAETLTNQALALNPAHPTAKTILNLIVSKKETSSVEDWVSQAGKLHSSGDLFGALAWVAEGLAVHPHDAKLLQIQDVIQRDQDARRRQARRGDVDDLRRMQKEIESAKDVVAKQALAERIQAVAAKHWTDGEILSIANALLLRLGLVSQESSGASPRKKGSTVILHVPRPSAPKAAPADIGQTPPIQIQSIEVQPSQVQPARVEPPHVEPVHTRPTQVQPTQIQTKEAVARKVSQTEVSPSPALPSEAAATALPMESPAATTPPSQVPPSQDPPSPSSKPLSGNVPVATPVHRNLRQPRPKQPKPAPAVDVPAIEPPAVVAKVRTRSVPAKQPAKSNSLILILVASAAAMILVAAIFFLAQKRQSPAVATGPAVTPTIAENTTPAPAASSATVSTPDTSAPGAPTPEVSQPAAPPSPDTASESVTHDPQAPAETDRSVGTLVIVAGQDGARVALNGRLLKQLTQGGQLRLPNLEAKDYIVQVSKNGFQDAPQQKIHIRKGEETRLIFNLQPQISVASLAIQGGAPGTAVFVDQTPVGTIQADGTLSISTISPGDHTVELRKDRFKPRQLKKHFVVGQTISVAAADAALEAVPGQLKINFSPTDAKVAVVKGDQLTVVNSGVPLNLAAGSYTLTARTADRFTRSATLEVVAGQSKNLDLSLAPNGMSKWDNPGAWKQEKDSFTRKGGDFVLYAAVPTSGTFNFSAMILKGHLLQWVLNYTDPRNYILFQMDENYFYRAVIRNGEKTEEIRYTDRGDKKSFRAINIRVSATEIVHEVKHGNSWTVVDRWTQPGANLSVGKFGFYIPGDDQVAVSSFSHYADLNVR